MRPIKRLTPLAGIVILCTSTIFVVTHSPARQSQDSQYHKRLQESLLQSPQSCLQTALNGENKDSIERSNPLTSLPTIKNATVTFEVPRLAKKKTEFVPKKVTPRVTFDSNGRPTMHGESRDAPFEAHFNETGLRFSVLNKQRNSRAHFQYKMNKITMGESLLSVGGDRIAHSSSESGIDFVHESGITERYVNLGPQIEQFFILDETFPLSKDGDLLISASFQSSSPTKTRIGPTSMGFSLFDPEANIMLRLGKLEIRDADGEVTLGSMVLDNGELSYRISGEWLRKARYPVIVDPTMSGNPQVAAAVPFFDGFESGTISDNWNLVSTGNGRIFTSTTEGPNTGLQHVILDADPTQTFSLNELILAVNMTGQTGGMLTFFHKEDGDEDDDMTATFTGSENSDGVAISADGTNWFRIVDLTSAGTPPISATYQQFTVDLDAAIAAAGISYNSMFFIKFQQYDNFSITTGDGFCFDDINVTVAAQAINWDALPSGDFGNFAAGNLGSQTFVLRNSGNTTATGVISLGGSTDFSFVSGGGNYTLAPGATRNVTVQFTAGATPTPTATLTATDGAITVTKPLNANVLQVATMPFFDGFESGTLSNVWQTNSTLNGRILVTTANGPNTGNNHLTMDATSSTGGNSTNELVLTIDLAGRSNVQLSFFMREFLDENNTLPTSFTGSVAGDGVAISADGTNWFRIVDLTSLGSPPVSATYQRYLVDLDAAIAGAGIAFNNAFQIKFQQTDNFSITTDGFAFDDVTLVDGNTPNILWDPLPNGDFGTTFTGLPVNQSFFLRNLGGGAANGNISLTGTGYSIVTGGGNFNLGAGDLQQVTVAFSPTVAATQTAVLNATAGVQSVDKNLTGVGQAGPVIAFDPQPTGDIGNVVVGQSTTRTFVLRNSGTVTGSGIVSLTGLEYTLLTGGGSYSLAAGATRNVTVRLSPTSIATRNGTLNATVTSPATFPTTTVSLTGAGVGANAIAWDAQPTGDFGVLAIGGTRTRTFVLRNNGSNSATGAIASSNPNFAITSGGGNFTLGAGASRNVTVVFTATVPGLATSNLTASSPGQADQIKGLSGSGLSPTAVAFDPTPTGNYGNVSVGNSSDRTFVLRNSSPGTVSGSISSNSSQFTVLNGGGNYSLISGETRAVLVRFAPLNVAAFTGQIAATVSNGNDALVSLTGTGDAPVNVVWDNLPDADFGTVTIGSSLRRTYVLRNTGSTVASGNISISQSSGLSIVTGSGAYSLNPGDTTNVVILCAPTVFGSSSATLTATVTGFSDVTKGLSVIGQFAAVASFPFSEGFENGALNPFFRTTSTNNGLAEQTTANGPNSGSSHFVFSDQSPNVGLQVSRSLNELILTIDLSNRANVTLSFFAREFSDDDDPLPTSFAGSTNGDGVSISEDGVNWFRVTNLTGTAVNGTYQQLTVDLSSAASSAGILLNNAFQIKFQQFGSDVLPNDGIAIDDISITQGQPVGLVTTLPASGSALNVTGGFNQDNLVALNLNIAANPVEDIVINSVIVSSQGTGDELAHIRAVRMVRDVNRNGAFDPGTDTPIGMDQQFLIDNGSVVFANLNQTIPLGSAQDWLVLFDISGNAPSGVTFQASLAQNGDISATGGNSATAIESTQAPAIGPLITINGPAVVFASRGGGGGGGGCSVAAEGRNPEALYPLLMLLALAFFVRRRGQSL